MPEESIITIDVKTALENLEDHSLDNHISRIQNYNTILNALEKDEGIDAELLKRLLAVCVHDTTILKYTATVINIILAILSKVKAGKYDPEPDLLPSALTVLTMIKTIALVSKVDSLMMVCYETLLSYPDKTLVAVAECEEVTEVFNLYCQLRIPAQTRLQACNLLHRLLSVLPPDKKKSFVENGIAVWFSKIIPTVMSLMKSPGVVNVMILEVLEMLTDELVHIDYSDNLQWQNILECICNTKQYPAMMKNLLNAGNSVWYRLWIVFIRLLKNKITQSLGSVGTPINSMLPVVESAFKLDVGNRCKAFECWNVLIDSFSTETNESNINKRIKLLIIPLRSNNAKTEETALAKFKCWWHLITKFQNKMDKFLDIVLVCFLNFCYGRYNALDKTQVVPGLISASTKKQCNQAIVDMFGHVNCDGCTDLPKLRGKIINTKHLVDNWNHWIYSLTSVIMKTANNSYGLTKQQMTCLWKSYLMTIGELPENNIRKDLFAEILSIVEHLVQECKSNNQFLDIAFNILILSLFDEDTKVKPLFKSDAEPNNPMTRIVKIILDPALYGYYLSLPSREWETKLSVVTKFIVDEGVWASKHVAGCLLDSIPINDFGLTLWKVLADTLCESNYKCSLLLHKMLLWPLNSIQSFTNVKSAAMTWHTTYNLMYPTLNKTDIDKEISAILFSLPDTSTSLVYFKLCVILGVLKQSITESNCMICEKEINLLHSLTKNIDNYENFEPIFPIMVDRIVAVMSIVATNVKETIAAIILICAKNVLHILIQACKQHSNVEHLMVLIGSLLKPLEKIFAVDSYSEYVPAMTLYLSKRSQLLSQHTSTQSIYLSVMRIFLAQTKVTDPNFNKIKSLISDIEDCKLETEVSNENNDKRKFTTPPTNVVPKRAKKKQLSIVGTVVEDGEKFSVIRSGWKFDPETLTDNQKEKLQRKRDNIPALYQDLSQSQDECRLMPWRTDSQDTTSSSKSDSKTSKAGTNETNIDYLKKLPSTDVVPSIIENIFLEKGKNNEKESLPKDNISKVQVSTPSPKTTKSPRMALKDRVFRNMRNLIENAGKQKENKDSPEEPNQSDINIKTPAHVKNMNTTNIVNSAPPLLSADRPSRVKRKPKKFEDLQLLTSKKARISLQDVYLDNAEQHNESVLPSNKKTNDDGKDITAGSHSPENYEENNDNSLQQLHDVVSNMDESNSVDNKIDKMNVAKATKGNETAITSSESNVIVTDNDQTVEQSKQQTNGKSQDDHELTAANNAREPILTPKISILDEVATPKIPKIDIEVVTPKSSKVLKEVFTSVVFKDVLKTLTPKTSKNIKDTSTPNSSDVKELAALKSSIDKEISSLKIFSDKDASTSIMSKAGEEVSQMTSKIGANVSSVSDDLKEASTIISSKACQVVSRPVMLKDVKEVLTLKSSKACKEVSNPTISKDIKEVSTPKSTKICTPRASKDFKSVSTPKDVDVLDPKLPNDIEEVLKSKSSIDLKTISQKPSKQQSSPNTPKEAKEVSTIKQTKESREISTPKQASKGDEQKSTGKRQSRIEKELAIDMVEGHPYLKMQSQKRLTRKTVETTPVGRRKSVAEKLNKAKSDINSLKGEKKSKDKNKGCENISTSSLVVDESQERDSESKDNSSFSDELPYSDDVIESSQDSTATTMSVKSMKKTPRKVPIVCVEKMLSSPVNNAVDINNSQSILDGASRGPKTSTNQECKDDSVLPLNKTVLEEKTQDDLTENMDTEPLDDIDISDDVIFINDKVPALTIATEETAIGPETQEVAEADTQPTDPKDFMDIDETPDLSETPEIPAVQALETGIPGTCSVQIEVQGIVEHQPVASKLTDLNNIVNITSVSLSEPTCVDGEQSSGVSSPFKDEAQRQQDFLHNTLEISPIKTMSPDRNKKSPSPDISSDYVVITLSSPVHSNGEPFEKCGSPEVFTEDKVSPDKRDQSPPRVEISVTSTSPSSSLSLKKNKPQVRSGGRAAHMLGLCVPDKVQAILNPERNESEEVKKSGAMNTTPARRNLRILYNSVSDTIENGSCLNESDDSDHFLKFRRSLPAVDSSPSGPILKRKFAEITDDAMVSLASKRKRVSFHDPPVSTTISVQKYIEPGGVRSPQNSAHKRLERQLRQHTPLKPPKRLENVFKLDNVLTKTVESFTENDVINIADDTQAFSLEETPELEIVRASEVNDSDPICPDLLDCKDPIESIAGELSSPAMKSLLIKELEGKVETVGDLAKMTELEVNRLCIKAPKVKVAKKVLTDYVSKRAGKEQCEVTITLDEAEFDLPMTEAEVKAKDIEVQTDRSESMDIEVQTTAIFTSVMSIQTEALPTAHTSTQTDESGSKSTEDIIKSCLSEKPDFVQQLGEHLEEPSLQQISDKLPIKAALDLLMKKITPSDTKVVLNRILEQECSSSNDRSKEISFIRDYLCGRFDTKALVLLCSQILKVVYDKPA